MRTEGKPPVAAFAAMFAPGGVERFFTESWGRAPVVLRPATPMFPGSHGPSDILDRYARSARLDPVFTTFSAAHPERSAERDRLVALFTAGGGREELAALALREAFVMRDLTRTDPFAAVCEEASRWWGTPITLNGYLVCAGADRFAVHCDPHHVFAIHTHGVKRWLFWPPRVHSPWSRYGWAEPPEEGPPERAVDVGPGEVLYVPLGWRHRTENQADSAVHFTLGVHPLRWAELLELLLTHAGAAHEVLRAEVPFAVGATGVTYEVPIQPDLTALWTLLERCSPDLLSPALELRARRLDAKTRSDP